MNKLIIVYFKCFAPNVSNDLENFRIVLKSDGTPLLEMEHEDTTGDKGWIPYCDYMIRLDGSRVHDLDILKAVVAYLVESNTEIDLGTL